MKVEIVNETDDPKTAHFQMDCSECKFNGCPRQKIYKEMGLLTDKLNTFCPYGRDLTWDGDWARAEKDNRLKYDLIVRCDNSTEIEKLDSFISLPNPPRRIVLSYIEGKDELIEKICGTNLYALKVFNPERRLELEYNAVKLEDRFNAATDASWFQVIDLADFDHTIMERLNRAVNERIERCLCILGHVYMKVICAAILNDNLELCDENILQLAKDEDKESFIRKVDTL